MAINPMLAMLIAQGIQKRGQDLVQGGARLFQERFRDTKTGKLLYNTSKEGNLSPATEKNILDKVGSTASRNADLVKNQYRGRAYNQGLEGSIAINRGLAEAEADVRRVKTDVGKDIYMDEEKAKKRAKLNYAMASDKDQAERNLAKVQFGGALLGVPTEVASQYFTKQYQDSQDQDPEVITSRMIKDGKSAEEILKILQLIQSQGS